MTEETKVKIEERPVAIIGIILVIAVIFFGPTGCAHAGKAPKLAAISHGETLSPETFPGRGASRVLPTVSYETRFKTVFGDRSYESCDPIMHIRKFLMDTGYLTPLPHGIVVRLHSSKDECTDHWEVDASVELLYPDGLLDQKLREALTEKFAPYKGL